MKIKQAPSRFALLTDSGRAFGRRGVVLTLLGVHSLVAMSLGYYAHRAGFRPLHQLERVIALPKQVSARLTRPTIPELWIDVKHANFMKLVHKRDVAIERGMLITRDDDFVPARILGMRIFSLQHPKTRNYAYEWLFHQAMKREGIIALRYEFVDLTLNGTALGLYALEEHFDKRLIENNHLREGPIIRFNEDRAWEEGGNDWWEQADDLTHYYASEIEPYQTGRTLSRNVSYEQFVKAKNLLEAVRRGQLDTSDVYDIPKLATFFAIGDLMGSYHIRNWNNMRFYYNPITSRLEPIGFDSSSGQKLTRLAMFPFFHVTSIHSELLFKDPRFLAAYVGELERVAAPEYLDAFLEEVDAELQGVLNLCYNESPDFEFSVDVFRHNQRFIANALNPIKGLHAYFRGSPPGALEVDLGNLQGMPIEVLGVSHGESRLFPPLDEVILPEAPILEARPVEYHTVRFEIPAGLVWSARSARDLSVHYRLLGTSRSRQVEVLPWSYLDTDFLERDLTRREPNAHEFPFLVTDPAAGEIRIRPGSWTLDRSLVLPGGFEITAGAGTRIVLVDDATILSRSPLVFLGTEERPVVIRGDEGAGQGVIVLNAEEPSVLEHVTFENLSLPVREGWGLTGAVTFYESPVRISRSRFEGSRAEDALNIVRSKFAIDETFFNETSSDALDVDFAEGSISDSSFAMLGGDAIDLSGTVVDIRNVRISDAGDKGLSVGENRQATVTDATVRGAKIAFASKDLSHLTIAATRVEASDTALAVYQKKSEFGPASMDARALQMVTVQVPHRVEVGSRLEIDGRPVPGDEEGVFQALYGRD
jgi:hypothetical protein